MIWTTKTKRLPPPSPPRPYSAGGTSPPPLPPPRARRPLITTGAAAAEEVLWKVRAHLVHSPAGGSHSATSNSIASSIPAVRATTESHAGSPLANNIKGAELDDHEK